MALHNITASGNQLVIELIVTEGDYAPSLITLKNPSIKLTTDRIKFLDSGIYQTALRFTDINQIGGVAPTDLEDAADLISALIANFSGGGSAPTYKVYTALLTQSGTNAPVATVLENTLGGDIVWTRLGVGTYQGELISAFEFGKTFVIVSNASTNAALGIDLESDAPNLIYITQINLLDNNSPADGLGVVPIKIEVYN